MKTKSLLAIMIVGILCAQTMAQEVSPEEFKEYNKQNEKRMADQMLASQMMRSGADRMLQNELEIMQEQANELRESATEFQRDMTQFNAENLGDMQKIAELFRTGEHRSAIDLSNKVFAQQQLLVDEMLGSVEEILLPHQVKRLMQISRQERIRTSNPYRDVFGVPVALADELELTAEEKEQLVETVERVREEYYEKLAEIRKEAKDEIMDSLPEEKRKKIFDILGEEYDQDSKRRISSDENRRRMRERKADLLRRKQESEGRDNKPSDGESADEGSSFEELSNE